MNIFYVITGGPGVGKTTLLNMLAKENYGYKLITVPKDTPENRKRFILNHIQIIQ